MITPCRISLYEAPKTGPAKYKKHYLIALTFVGIIWLINFAYASLVLKSNPDASLFYVFVIMPILLLLDSLLRERLFITFDESSISFRNGYIRKSKTIIASDIRRIKVKVTDIIIYTKDGEEYAVDIGNSKFSDIEKIKHYLLEFQTQYNIAS